MALIEGHKVVCISEDFPVVRTTQEDKSCIWQQAPTHPQKGETLVIDEMLGDFLRFDKYDTDAFNWWHSKNFRPLDEIITEMPEYETELLLMTNNKQHDNT